MYARRLSVLLAAVVLSWTAQASHASTIAETQCFGADRDCTPAIGLVGAAAVTVSPDARTVYVGGNVEEHGWLLVYARDPATGALTPIQCFADPPTVKAAPDAG